MDSQQKQDILVRLNAFYREFKRYRGRLLSYHRTDWTVRKKQRNIIESFRLKLLRNYAQLESTITRYSRKPPVLTSTRGTFGLFEYCLSDIELNISEGNYADLCFKEGIELLNMAIGKAEGIEVDNPNQNKSTEVISLLGLFDNMMLRKEIIEVSRSLFETAHFAQAIFEAYKAVNNFVKNKAETNLDGRDLMAKVFREDQPVIKLNKLKTTSEKDEQEGFKFIFMGSIVGIRNPKAHDMVIQSNPYKTLEYLALASLLLRMADEGKLIKSRAKKLR